MLAGAVAGSILIASMFAAAVSARGGAASAPFVVPCGDTIGNLSNPAGSDRKVALGMVSLPSRQVGSERLFGVLHWRYWTKVAVGIRHSPTTVTVSVPKNWRSRVAVGWGNRTIILPSIRFSSCTDATSPSWSTYAGGLYLAKRVRCVPLAVSDGRRTATVRIAVDGTCG